uniref:hypothetical protein n=1 Tax=Agathobacter sp. TaxID=2021311 RepID=UPI004055A890
MNWCEERLKQELYEVNGFLIEEICNISTYEEQVSEKVLFILLQWACYGQNESGILFGREQIATIPKKWLQEHLLTVVKNDFEYTDDWNYRRLLELVSKQVPELMKDVLLINSDTNNPDLLEVIEDFR